MAGRTTQTDSLIRLSLTAAAVWMLLHWVSLDDGLAAITRPVVVALLEAGGVLSHDAGHELVVGRLRVPWARDCSGASILTTLAILTIWAHRTAPLSGSYWWRLALVWPVAYVANILRILTLIAYRHCFFPMVEGPALHYFIGFVWVAPCLGIFLPRGGRAPQRYWLETLHLMAVLACLSPQVHGPGGSIVTITTLTLLIRNHHLGPSTSRPHLASAAWLISGGFIGLVSMDSLWLPWLLACPWFCRWTSRSLITAAPLLAGAVPLIAMQPVAAVCVLTIAGWELWRLTRGRSIEPTSPAVVPTAFCWRRFALSVGASLALVLPFLATSLSGVLRPTLRPPAGTLWRELAANTYELRLLGQSRDIDLVCYGPAGDGRHHSLPVCMEYRGVTLQPSPEMPSVLTDGKFWRQEFFLQKGTLLTNYPDYLRATFWPWRSAGLHLIASAPVHKMSATTFSDEVGRISRQVSSLSVNP